MDNCFNVCENLNNGDNNYDVLIAQLHNEIAELCKTSTAKFLMYDGKVAELCSHIKNNFSNTLRCLFADMKHAGEIDTIISESVLNQYELLTLDVAELKQQMTGIVTPQMFGGVGDGLNDDTTAIEKAIATGKTVHFPKGVYRIVNDFVINKNDVVLIGDNAVIDLEKHNFTIGNVNEIKNISNIMIKGIKFKNGGVSITRTQNFKFVSCDFSENEYGLRGSHCYVGVIEGCEFNGCANGLIFDKDIICANYTADHNSITVNNCNFYNNVNPFIIRGGFVGAFTNNRIEGNKNGIVIEGMSDYIIRNNYFEYNKGTIITLNTYAVNSMLNNGVIIGSNRIFGDSSRTVIGLSLSGTIMGLILETNTWGGLGELINKGTSILSGCYFMRQVNNSGLLFPNLNTKYSSIDNTLVLNPISDTPSIMSGRMYLKDNHIKMQTRLGDYDVEFNAGYVPVLNYTPKVDYDGLLYLKGNSLKIVVNGVEKTVKFED